MNIISTACTRCWQPIRKRIGISCLYPLVFSEDNIGGKSETGSTLIGNGSQKNLRESLKSSEDSLSYRLKIVSP